MGSLFTKQQARTGNAALDAIINQIQGAVEQGFADAERMIRAVLEPEVHVVSGDAVIESTWDVVEYNGPGGHKLTLPSAARIKGRRSRRLVVLNTGAGTATLVAQTNQTIDDAATIELAAGAKVSLDANGDTKLRSAGVSETDDGTGYESFAHVSGNAGLAAHWNVAGMVTGNGLTTYYSPAANTFYAIPFVAPRRGGSIIALAYDSNVATGNSRIAVYDNTAPATLYPNALLGESGSKANLGGSLVVSTTGLNFALTAGELYWLAYVNDNAAASIRKLDPGACSGMLGAPLAQISTPPGIKVAFTYAAPPVTFPAGGAYINTSSDFAPALGYRVGA